MATSFGLPTINSPPPPNIQDWANQTAKLSQIFQEEEIPSDYLNFSPIYPENSPDFVTKPLLLTLAKETSSTRSIISHEQTSLLPNANKAYNTTNDELILCAFALAVNDIFGQKAITINMEGHGRDAGGSTDITQIVGWFTTFYPVNIVLPEDTNIVSNNQESTTALSPNDIAKCIMNTKECVRTNPVKGLTYGLLAFSSGASPYRHVLEANIIYNNLGSISKDSKEKSDKGKSGRSGIFKLSNDPIGPVVSPENAQTHLLDINVQIANEGLVIDWVYSTKYLMESTICSLARAWEFHMSNIILHCCGGEDNIQSIPRFAFTPSDFELMMLKYPIKAMKKDRLDKFVLQGGLPRTVQDVYPLTPMQEGMLFHSLRDPRAYLIQVSFIIRGKTDLQRFYDAWQAVVCAHDTLRSCFRWEGLDWPLQVVMRPSAVKLDWVYQEMSNPIDEHNSHYIELVEKGQEMEKILSILSTEAASSLLEKDRVTPLDLGKAPLARLSCFDFPSIKRTIFSFVFHHILVDGWSLPHIMQSVFAVFHGVQLPQAPSYRNLISYLLTRDSSLDEWFWRNTLSDFEAATPVPLAQLEKEDVYVTNPSEQDKSADFVSQSQIFPLTEKNLQPITQRMGATPSTLVRGAWALLLSRHCRENDVVFGVTVSGRSMDEVEGASEIIGLFINTLPFRAIVPDDPYTSVAEWIRSLQDKQADMMPYEHTALVQIQAWSSIPRGSPLFHSILVYENYPMSEGAIESSKDFIELLPNQTVQTSYPITLIAEPNQRGIEIRCEYNRKMFQESSVACMLSELCTILMQMVSVPDLPVTQVYLVSPEEEHLSRIEWNSTCEPYPVHECMHQLFEKKAAQTPDDIAVWYKKETLTYKQLNSHANHLAVILCDLGVAPDTLVGVLLDKSLEMVVGMLGVLKAGGAYVPVDPTYPEDRIAYQMEDSNASIVLTQTPLRHLVPKSVSAFAQVLCVDIVLNQNREETEETEPPVVHVTPENVLYSVYTSGTTGKPKGILMPHRSLCNLMFHHIMDGPLRTMNFPPLGFDVATQDSMIGLISGGGLCIPESEKRKDPYYMLEWLIEMQVERVFWPPAYLQTVAEVGKRTKSNLSCLKQLFIAGEALKITSAIREWMKEFVSNGRIINHYGPAETHVVTYYTMCEPNESHFWPNDPAIGRPILNTSALVLDRHMCPLPVGAIGELYFSGHQVSRGYLRRPIMTAQRFLPSPIFDAVSFDRAMYGTTPLLQRKSCDGGVDTGSTLLFSRMYMTGDLARWTTKGYLECLGRADDQVKLRGFRIELGEVEAAMSEAAPEATQCVSVVREDVRGKYLVGYVVPRRIDLHALRTHLESMLPSYMVPSFFVALDELPLSANGKVDRKRLPAPDYNAADDMELKGSTLDATKASQALILPETVVEKQVVEIFQSVLSLHSLPSMNADFFDLGGHSLTAVRLCSRLGEAFGCRIPLSDVFELRTPRNLSTKIETSGDAVDLGSAAKSEFLSRMALLCEAEEIELLKKNMANHSKGDNDSLKDSQAPNTVISTLGMKLGDKSGLCYPTSFAQERLWFLQKFSPESCAYNMPFALQLLGEVNVNRLLECLMYLVNQHAAFRTVLEEDEQGIPVQRVMPKLDIDECMKQLKESGRVHAIGQLELEIIDSRNHSLDESEKILKNLLYRQTVEPFDLSTGVLRTFVVQMSDSLCVVVWCVHHIAFDGFSQSIVINDLCRFYAYSGSITDLDLQGKDQNFLRIQYTDYARWQRKVLNDTEMQKQLQFWRNFLQGAPTTLELSTDFRRPAVSTHQGDIIDMPLPKYLQEAISKCASRYGITEFVLLLTIYAITLGRHSRQHDILIGTPVANRTHSGLEEIVGFFVNTLVLRVSFNPSDTFESVLLSVSKNTLHCFEHQDVPFERIVNDIGIRDTSRSPLFQASIALNNTDQKRLELGEDIRVAPVNLDEDESIQVQSKYEISLNMQLDPEEGYSCAWVYKTSLFRHDTVQRMSDHFLILLRAFIEHPDDCFVMGESMLTPEEDHCVMIEWNAVQSPYNEEQCLHDAFRSCVERMPNKPLLVYRNESKTYTEIDRCTDVFASMLIDHGVARDVIVGLLMERSIETFVSIFAIFKAGGAYLPLDPSHPAERTCFILIDAATPVVLTQSHISTEEMEKMKWSGEIIVVDKLGLGELQKDDNLVATARSRLVAHDNAQVEHCDQVAEFREDYERTTRRSRSLAYVIYTSGTTGRPKGVGIEHSSSVNQKVYLIEYLKLTEYDTVVQKTPLTFDASTNDIFMTMAFTGTTLVISEPGAERDPAQLAHLIDKHNVTVFQMVPSLGLPVAEELKNVPNRGKSLRMVTFGGEALPQEVIREYTQNFNVEILNLYGPTEASVDTTWYQIDGNRDYMIVPIGWPFENYRIYVVNERMDLLGAGTPGQLVVAGIGLARGYLNRPDLNAEKFGCINVRDRRERVYQTGDLVRWSQDGAIEYFGRTDFQVKLRGLRIELFEIESVAESVPGIKQAAATIREDTPGWQYLALYVTPYNTDIIKLKEHLSATLPSYMVPSAIVPMKVLPLSLHGKVDRKSLPIPADFETMNQKSNFVEPSNQTEAAVAEIFASLLGRERVGATEDFFDLGGHSLLVMRLVRRLANDLGVRLPVAQVFSHRTPRDLAFILSSEKIKQKSADVSLILGTQISPVVPLNRVDMPTLDQVQQQLKPEPLFLVHPAGGTVFPLLPLGATLGEEYQAQESKDGRIQPRDGDSCPPIVPRAVLGLECVKDAPLGSIPELADFYLNALEDVWGQGPVAIGGYSFGVRVAFDMAVKLQRKGRSVTMLVAIDAPAHIPEHLKSNDVQVLRKNQIGSLHDGCKNVMNFLLTKAQLAHEDILDKVEAMMHDLHQLTVSALQEANMLACIDGATRAIMNQLPDDLHGDIVSESIKRFLQVSVECSRMDVEYVPQYNLDNSTHIVLIRASDLPPKSEAHPVVWIDDFGISGVCNGPILISHVPGNHSTIIGQHVKDLASALITSMRSIASNPATNQTSLSGDVQTDHTNEQKKQEKEKKITSQEQKDAQPSQQVDESPKSGWGILKRFFG